MVLIPIDWKMKMIYTISFISISFDFKFDLTSSDLVCRLTCDCVPGGCMRRTASSELRWRDLTGSREVSTPWPGQTE